MIGDSLLLSVVSVLGFVGGLFGLLLVLAWLEHPEPPSWFRRREPRRPPREVAWTGSGRLHPDSARRANRQLAGDDEDHPIGDRDGVVGDALVVTTQQGDVHR